jgi:multiple sugar transport system permease protein
MRELAPEFHPVLPYLFLIPFLIFALFPFFWMLITSFKNDPEIYNIAANPFWIKTGITLKHYTFLLKKTGFIVWFKNSLIISILATGLSIAVSVLAAYSLARLRFRGSSLLGIAIFVTYLIPPTLLFIPLSEVVAFFRLSDSIFALILIYPTFAIPFSTWLLMGYFSSVPRAVEEAAMVDGASRWQILMKVVIPITIPGIVTATLFSFTLSWGHMLYGTAFVSSSTQKPLTAGIVVELIRGDVFFWGSLMAGALLGSLPIVACYTILTEFYISGLTKGAVKY